MSAPDYTHVVDHQSLWKDGNFFAQIQGPSSLPTWEECDGKSVHEVTRLVASKLLGSSYKLEDKPFQSSTPGMEVYDTLTQILPKLSDQSEFYWSRAARPLASLLSSAKYPIRSQASHLVFWWARLGGLNGVTRIGLSKQTRTFWVRDGSNTELSWVIPQDTDPEGEVNRHPRFAIDPFHPVTGRRLAGGAVIDWLWGEGGMGLVDNPESGKQWKEIIEKWLYPGLESTEEIVPGGSYAIAFDLEPDGVIGLKQYYVPPRVGTPEANAALTTVTLYRHPESIEPIRTLLPQLHESLIEPFNALCDYLKTEGKASGLKFIAIACDITTLEKNRLKMYFWPTAPHSLNDVIRDLTLGGKHTGPRVADAIASLRKLHAALFPNATDDTIMLANDGGPGGLSYYYELFVGERLPSPKAYFDMTAFGKNDLDSAKRVETFFASVGKKGKEGWYSSSLQRAFPHRSLDSRTGIQTGVTFAMKPKGWQTYGYMCTEIYAVERYPDDPQTHDEMIQEHYDIYMGRRRKRSLLAMEQNKQQATVTA